MVDIIEPLISQVELGAWAEGTDWGVHLQDSTEAAARQMQLKGNKG
jgi:hypothetical protein